jgi:hypothetical protein
MNLARFAADTLKTSRPNRDAGLCTRYDGQMKPGGQHFGNNYRYD